MAVFTFLIYTWRGPFIIASPEPTTQWIATESNNQVYIEWATKTGDRLQIASISFLVVGFITFVMVICLILFEDKWVAKIVSKFPNHSTPEDGVNEGPTAVELK